jgi:hypothetical protein
MRAYGGQHTRTKGKRKPERENGRQNQRAEASAKRKMSAATGISKKNSRFEPMKSVLFEKNENF